MSVGRQLLLVGWTLSAGGAIGLRAWNAIFGPLFYGYDAWGHIAYVFFIDMYHAIPYADQGWSYFHPPLHYLIGWALMQAGDPEFLIVGLSLVGSLASLGVAFIGSRVVRRALPEWPAMALLAFTAVAFLPVHVYTSPMPGNEMTGAFFATAAFAAHLRNELRERPQLAGDALTGVLCGLAMLSKFTDVIACIAIACVTTLRLLRSGQVRRELPRFGLRAIAIALPMLLLMGPYYGRNVAEFGTPFMTSAKVHDVERIQASQPPGERSWLDFVAISPKVFADSNGAAPHMIHSVWANTYLNVWFDSYREGQLPLPRWPIPHPSVHQLTIFFGMLGVIPTLAALYGAAIAALHAVRRRDAVIEQAMWILSLGTVAAFVIFAILIPTWAALKASYLLTLSLPYAYFLARGVASLSRREPVLGVLPPLLVAVVALATTVTFAAGGLLRRHMDSHQMVSVNAHFGDFAPTRRIFRRDSPTRSYLEARAAAELFDGHPDVARRFYRHATLLPMKDPTQLPYWTNRLAVASALEDKTPQAQAMLDDALQGEPLPELLVNRGAVRAQQGDLAGAEADLRAALSIAERLPPAWRNLAFIHERRGEGDEANLARQRADALEQIPPRGFPYGVGNGYLYDSGAGQRFMLELSGPPGNPSLEIYRPPRARNRRHTPPPLGEAGRG